MQSETVKKTQWWRLWWRRINRRTPFWKQRPDDGADLRYGPWDLLGDFAGDVVDLGGFVIIATLLVVFLIAVVIGPTFLSPDFMSAGLADPIGRALAALCQATGQCNIQYLLAGSASAVLILMLIPLVLLHQSPAEVVDDNDTIATVLEATSALDERIVRLRADLVVAGVLKVSDEERADSEVPEPYHRPVVTDEQQRAAQHLALDLTSNKSTADIRRALAALAIENGQLLAEVNTHRQARGYALLPVVETK